MEHLVALVSAEDVPSRVSLTVAVDYDGVKLAVMLDLWELLHLPAKTILPDSSVALPRLETMWMSDCLMICRSFPSFY